ncbi:Uncharacterised protein [Mycobacterium tuberculosis]|nr:Uncharacterised protein [Mycobacterium tuberculosis]
MTTTGDLPVNRPLQRRAAYSGREPLEGFTHALRLVLSTAAVFVQAFLALERPGRWVIQEAMSDGVLCW